MSWVYEITDRAPQFDWDVPDEATGVRFAEQACTVLVSSPILEEVELLADRIVLMVSGKLAAAGSPQVCCRPSRKAPPSRHRATW